MGKVFRWSLTGAFVCFALAAAGCASRGPQKEKLLYWPLPPDEPRIAYVASYYGSGDFKNYSFWDTLFGTTYRVDVNHPYGVAAADGKIYVTVQMGRPSVCVIDPHERKVSFIGDSGAGRLTLPMAVAVSKDGIVYVADAQSARVFGYDAEGTLKISIGKTGEFRNPVGLAINEQLGRLYVVDSKEHRVDVFTLKGKPLFQFGKKGGEDGEFFFPSNIAIDARNGNLYVVDTQNFRVQEFDRDGKFIRKFGHVGDSVGSFFRPRGIAVDSEGHVYVSDAAFDNFQVFNDAGQVLLFIGSTGIHAGQLQLPAGMYIDGNDTIYVADTLNNRVEVFQYLSEAWKKKNPEEYKKYLLP